MKILVVEDVTSTRYLLQSLLKKWGYDVVAVESCEEAWDVYRKKGISFIILDWIMPGTMQGIDLVNKIRSLETTHYTYIILLTSKKSRQDIKEGVDAGVDDYVIKPFDQQELKVRVQLGRRNLVLKNQIFTLQEENVEINNENQLIKWQLMELTKKYALDQVSGVYNRFHLQEKIEEENRLCLRDVMPLSIIVVYIRTMKRIKKTYSYKAMDAAVLEVVKRLESLNSPRDFIGRFSEDEFIVVLPGSNLNQANNIAYMILDKLHESPFILENKMQVELSSVTGTACSTPDKPETVENMILQAMYKLRRIDYQKSELYK